MATYKFILCDIAKSNFHFAFFGCERMQVSLGDLGFLPIDEIDILPTETHIETKFGDIWQLGRHYLLCGDSTDIDTVKNFFDGNKIDLVLTDPPYGVNAVEKRGRIGSKGNLYHHIKGDDSTKTARNFYQMCQALNIKNYIVFGGNYFTDFLPPNSCWLVWDKKNGASSFGDFEMAWTSFKKASRLYEFLWSGAVREGDIKSEGKTRIHPTQKPVGLIAKMLSNFSEPNQNIFDGFGGSGSTLIACEKTNRKCFMIEYENFYVDLIISRWEKFTGQKAKLIRQI